MFFHVRREKNVVLEPRHFGARMKDVIMEKIKLRGTTGVLYAFARFFFTLYFVSFSPVHLGVDFRSTLEMKTDLSPPRHIESYQMEGTCSGRYGFIVCITHIENVSEGIITDDGTARAKFEVESTRVSVSTV